MAKYRKMCNPILSWAALPPHPEEWGLRAVRRMKRPFTLLELLISLGLTATLLTLLMRILYTATASTQKLEEEFDKVLETTTLQYRLQPILDHLVRFDSPGRFFSRGNSSQELLFTFWRGVDQDPHLCGSALGQLWVDKEKRLVLTLWPSQENWGKFSYPSRSEVLLEEVNSLCFEFYVPPDREKPSQVITPSPVHNGHEQLSPPTGWFGEWKPQYSGLPAMIRIRIDRPNKEELLYCFSPIDAKRDILFYVHREE